MRHYWLTSDAPDLPGNAFQKAFGRNRPATLEGGKGGSAPSTPDPYVTAAATTQTNNATAAYNKALNATNYSNPFGSQSTSQIGTDPTTGAAIYGSTITANPQLQSQLNGLLGQTANSGAINNNALSGLYSLNGQYNNLAGQYGGLNSGLSGLNSSYDQLRGGLSSLGNQYGSLYNQYGALGNQLNQGQAAQAQQQGQNAAYAAQTQYLDPQFAQQGESLSAQLANQGLTPGSQAYNNAMTNFNNQKQQAYSNAANQAVMTGSQIGSQNLQNQISGINTQAGLLGAQGSNLGAQAGLYGQQAGLLGNQIGAYGQQMNALNGMSGLYGLAGQLGSGQLSALGTGLNSASQQAGLFGQQVGIGQTPYSNLSSLASLVPGVNATAQSAAAPADIAGNINNQYQSQLASHNADVQSGNSTTSAIAGLAGAAAMAFF